ncbi:recombinase RecQ [Photobacterium jeanii]|uniref:ATP-dependent DNA helicase RecQ n=1 Tax=Photobacterium jeanii TaxID=858640 RepID=A0A178K3H2_9GAMM|nr:RecQ family ATP-dependent DNA helicase [Photobacterium jeanii]OAN11274.1 recombinase RecQ [Photobacterium jeanii]PST90794.1 RecQ family ATP-dependent DNA helicase [Photobacterium jeanii]
MYQQTLQQVFGFNQLRGGQENVITRVLEGQSAAAIFPTGSGKSLCYQLPALHLPNLTLVISPLLALMHDQLDFLQQKGIAAASIDSSQTWEQSQQVMQDVRAGKTKILMISVERLKNERFRHFIQQVPISLLVVDEAHCISEWGHNFRPDYLKLPDYRQQLNIPQVLLLTATATPAVIKDMQAKFAIDEANTVVTGFYRHNLDLAVKAVTEEEKRDVLQSMLSQAKSEPSIVYVTLQHTAEDTAAYLNQQGIRATAYHAGLNSEVRENIQQQFMNGTIHCIVATIAFGMGIDKADIRHIIHYDLPKSIENYSQEIGRAGRDNQSSHCTVLANRNGVNVLENFVYGDTPDRDAIYAVLKDIKQQQGQWDVMLHQLSRESNIRALPLKTLLVYLEIEGVIEAQYSYFADYRFKPIQTPEWIISQFQGERQHFVKAIFDCSPKARTWHSIDFETLWQGFQADRKRVVAAIDYFNEKGWLTLESKQMTEVFKIVEPNFNIDSLADSLHATFSQKENTEIERLHTMLNFFESNECLSHRLARYFADENAPQECGHCSVCRNQPATLPSNSEQLTEPSANTLKAWCDPFIEAVQTQTQAAPTKQAITRFLVGMTTPLNTKVKARQMSGFAKLEQYPFQQVLNSLNFL